MANTLVNVQLFKTGVEGKFGVKRKLVDLVESESVEDLQAHTVEIVTNDYIGDATVVAKGAKIPLSDLKQTKNSVTFEKIAKGVKVTDEELKQTFGDALGNAENQTVKAIENKMEAKVAELFTQAKLVHEYEDSFGANTVLDAIAIFGEDYETEENFLLVNPAEYAALQSEIKGYDNTTLQPTLYGATLVMTSRVEAGEAAIIQKGAIKELIQKDIDVELSRDASAKSTEIYTDIIYGAYIQDQSKILVIKPSI